MCLVQFYQCKVIFINLKIILSHKTSFKISLLYFVCYIFHTLPILMFNFEAFSVFVFVVVCLYFYNFFTLQNFWKIFHHMSNYLQFWKCIPYLKKSSEKNQCKTSLTNMFPRFIEIVLKLSVCCSGFFGILESNFYSLNI